MFKRRIIAGLLGVCMVASITLPCFALRDEYRGIGMGKGVTEYTNKQGAFKSVSLKNQHEVIDNGEWAVVGISCHSANPQMGEKCVPGQCHFQKLSSGGRINTYMPCTCNSSGTASCHTPNGVN